VRILNWEELGRSSAPLTDIATRGLGLEGGITMSVIALFATASTVLITMVAGSRILYGMAKAGSLPSLFGKVHSKTGTPWIAVIGIFVTSVAFAFIGDIVIVANIVVFAVVITFAMINLSVILLRYVRPDEERAFRVPLNIGKFPILPLFGFGATVYMAMQFELEIILVGIGIIIVGIIFYLLYNKRKINPASTNN
jgi:APA family basic amino acid/polyamine antiporter